MSRQHTSESSPVTKKTLLSSLKDIDPDAVGALNSLGIYTIGQLQKSEADFATIIHRSMTKRPLSASKAVQTIIRYRAQPLMRSSPISSRQPLAPSVTTSA